MRFVTILMMAVSVVVAAPVASVSPSVAAAQEIPEMPPLGALVVEDALAGTGPFRIRTCPTGRNGMAFVEGGLEIKVTGRCTETATGTVFGVSAAGLTAAHGEFSIEAKLVDGYDRGWLALSFREQANGDLYVLNLSPSRHRVELRKAIGSIGAVVAERTDVEVMGPDTWTRIGVRLEGQRFWVLLNDQPIVSATDPSLARGGFSIVAGRFGNPDDDAPVTTVWRNLRVAALANQPAPTASQPPAGPPAASGPPDGTPPAAGRVVHAESLAERGIIPTGSCRTGRGRGEVVGEGFLLAVRGKCTDASVGASVTPTLTGLTVPDGEVRFEFKVTNGYERSSLLLGARSTGEGSGAYVFALWPGRGVAFITKVTPGQPTSGLVRRDDWNTMSVRLHGPSLWLLVNDQAMLTVEDATYPTGRVWLGLAKLDNPDDEDEVAVVYRNVSIAAIEGAPDDRAPTYVRPAPRPAGPGSDLTRLDGPAEDGAHTASASLVASEPATR